MTLGLEPLILLLWLCWQDLRFGCPSTCLYCLNALGHNAVGAFLYDSGVVMVSFVSSGVPALFFTSNSIVLMCFGFILNVLVHWLLYCRCAWLYSEHLLLHGSFLSVLCSCLHWSH